MTNRPIKKKKKAARVVLIVFLSILLALLIAVGTFFFLIAKGKISLKRRTTEIEVPEIVDDSNEDGTVITYNGVKYRFNENAVSVLFMGVDKEDIKVNGGSGNNGQADSIFVGVMDTETGEVSIIPISRECMTEIRTYSADGGYVGTETSQVCLAYAYGGTAEECGENMVDAVQNLLYGMTINAYVAIDMQGVLAITDAIGGVTLTTLDEKTCEGTDLPSNTTLTLKGRDIYYYIQWRTQNVDANVYRLRRQKQFLGAFFTQAKGKIKDNPTSIINYYNVAKPYIVSNLNLSEVTYLAKCSLLAPNIALKYMDIKGETVMGEEHTEFHPDEISLYEAVLNAFYIKEE